MINLTNELELATKELQSSLRGYVLTGKESLLITNSRAEQRAKMLSDTLLSMVEDNPVQNSKVQGLLQLTHQSINYSNEVISLYEAQGYEAAVQNIREGFGIELSNKVRTQIKEIDEYESQLLQERKDTLARAQQSTELLANGTNAIAILLTVLALYFMRIDIRKRENLRRKLKEREQILNQYLEAIPDGIIVVDPDQRVVFLNHSGKAILGTNHHPEHEELQLSELVGSLNFQTTAGKTPYDPENLPLKRALKGTRSQTQDILFTKEDQSVNLGSSAEPIFDTEGQVAGAISVFRDISLQVAYETELEKARKLAEQSVRVKDVFLSNVSHEIRTPLNAIIGFTNLLEEEVREEKSHNYVKYIQLASKNLLELINDILDSSKIEAEQLQLDKLPTSIHDLVESVSVIVMQRAQEKGVQYERYLDPQLPPVVETDKLRLSQILLNLCGNAVKFTEKGTVKLSITALPPAASESATERTIRFVVTDSGIGIPDEKLHSVFERFVQASEDTTRKFGGTGLGLSIVKSLVQLLGGTIKAESQVGTGSTFTMDIPFRVLDESDLERRDTQRPANGGARLSSSLRILAAEDNTLNQKLLTALFERMGITITLVSNGLEALECLRKKEFDIVLMDLQMPDMDGYTAIRQIRNSLELSVPIITMTAHAMIGEREECLRIGANDYISKPFKESELVATILRLTEGKVPPELEPNQQADAPADVPGSLLDLRYLGEISGEDDELLNELINLFEEDYPLRLRQIGEAYSEQQWELLRAEIHKFRSSLHSVGMLATADRYKAIEIALTQKNTTADLGEILNSLRVEVERAALELSEARNLYKIR
ncbi:PAS domain S-box-containing protein [Rhabdobacter roseus]|uniref:histidine kinase n=1 Tax=Rhabdobacter roseus TaxID=1655419 RepID=A0A840U0N2_9BACT|nr:PAS domain S-box-containing protein [Rhabdobacter roseus]